MPESDGYVLLDFLKDEHKQEDLIVFVCSGYIDEAGELLAKYDVARIIDKPFSLMKELEVIEESISSKFKNHSI